MTDIWHITPQDYPKAGTIEEKIKFFLRYAILAPSAHNTQPWRYEITGSALKVFRDPENTLQVGDPTMRETIMGIGTFIEAFIQAANHFGYKTEVEPKIYLAEELHIADIHVFEDETDPRKDLFEAITQRHTNRGAYEPSLEATTIEALHITEEPQVKQFFITEIEPKQKIGQLVRQATFIALSMRAMREEIAQLVYIEGEDKAHGMSLQSMLATTANPTKGYDAIMHHMDVKAEAEEGEKKWASTPVIIVIGSELDGPQAWLASGRTLMRTLLAAAAQGLTHDISAGPVEIPTIAPLLRKEIDPNFRPQCLVRVGKPLNPDFTKPSTRRPIQ